jgi:hypothetical protein
MLRPYFLRHRELLGDLCRASWQTVREMMAAAAGEEIRPGMVAVVQTFGSTINFHPHIHAIVSRGGWTKGGDWFPVPWVDARAAEQLFRHKVLSFLRQAGLIDEQRIALLLSWKHTGFSVHNSVSVQAEDAEASERLVRYVMRAPVSQERLEIDADFGEVRLRAKAGADDEWTADQVERLDPDEVVARIRGVSRRSNFCRTSRIPRSSVRCSFHSRDLQAVASGNRRPGRFADDSQAVCFDELVQRRAIASRSEEAVLESSQTFRKQ